MPGGKKGRYAPPVHMIKLTETREITPYVWVHPDEERSRLFLFGSATERAQPGTRWLLSRKKGRVSNGSESQSHSGRQV